MSASQISPRRADTVEKREKRCFPLHWRWYGYVCLFVLWAQSCLFCFTGYRSYCSGALPPCRPAPLVDTLVVCIQQDRHSISGAGSKYTLGGAASSWAASRTKACPLYWDPDVPTNYVSVETSELSTIHK